MRPYMTLKTRKINWGTPQANHNQKIDHGAVYGFSANANIVQPLAKNGYNQNQQQQCLIARLEKRKEMIRFYKQDHQRRQMRHISNIMEKRKQKEGQIQKLKKQIAEWQQKNSKLRSGQIEDKLSNSMSYSTIKDQSELCEQDILKCLDRQ